jgi:hypothetical protein
MPSRRTVLGSGLATTVALLAGCTSGGDAPVDSSTPTDPTPEPSPTQAPTADGSPAGADDATPTDIGRTTPREPVGTGRNPADVVLSNGDDRSHEVRVTARRQDAADPHYDQSVTLDPDGRYRMNPLERDDPGTHVLRFRLADGTERRYEWDLTEQSEDGWLSVGVTEEGTFVVQYAMA